ncbi:ferredoxin reductase family protein [Microbacterium lacticum]
MTVHVPDLVAASAPSAPAASAAPRRAVAPATLDAAWHAAAVAFIWLTSLAIAALWVAGGGVQAVLGGGAESANTLGRLTGLTSANLLLYQVLLMARVPLFERGIGRDAIARMHRITGFWSFWLMLAHVVLLVVGYSQQAGVSLLAQAWDLAWNYPGMLLATAGTLLLVLVVVTSVRRARRRLRYESWHLLHLYAYLGVGLAIPHMLWTGADFTAHAWVSVYWWALWALTAAAVVVFRVCVPLWRSVRHGIRVSSVEHDGPRGVVVRMSGRALHRLRARPGQFFVWRFLDGRGWTRGHPFSLAADPGCGGLAISARVVGDGTHRLTRLRPGTRVLIEGPYGHMTGRVRMRRRLLMFGAGAGVAPLLSLLQAEPYGPGDATLVTRDHVDEDALGAAAVDALVRQRGLRHIRMNGPRRTGGSSWMPRGVTDWPGAEVVRSLAGDVTDVDVYVCGPIPWMAALRQDLRSAGVPADRIHSEAFAV